MSDFLDKRFPGGTNRQVNVDLPTLWIVQRLDNRDVAAICVDAAAADWWVANHGEPNVGYEKFGKPLTIIGIPGTITVRRMEVSRDGTPRVL